MASEFHFIEPQTAYGKTGVRLLKNVKHGSYHQIKEIEVQSELCLNSKKDYLHGDNGDVIPTDTQKNTIYALAKEHGLESIEEFALKLIDHFLSFNQVHTVKVSIEETPWQRIKQNGVEHSHAFIVVPDVIRFCDVQQSKGGQPIVSGGLKGMRILKTTQSGFVGFNKDKFTTLPEAYSERDNFGVLCRPPDTGIYSKSVQQSMYLTEAKIMNSIPQIASVEMRMPNVHYFTVNMAPYGMVNKDEILMPTDKPSGIIRAVLSRTPSSKL